MNNFHGLQMISWKITFYYLNYITVITDEKIKIQDLLLSLNALKKLRLY